MLVIWDGKLPGLDVQLGEKYSTKDNGNPVRKFGRMAVQFGLIDKGFIANEEILNSPHGLGGKPVIATLTWVGQPVSEDIVKNIRQLWSQRETSSQAGVTQLISGLLCRYRGNSTQEVINWFTDVWQLLRQNYTGKSIVKPRVWQL